MALRTRANLLQAAVTDGEPYAVVCWHALELVGMMRARGMA